MMFAELGEMQESLAHGGFPGSRMMRSGGNVK
jgi:hypothetical protein